MTSGIDVVVVGAGPVGLLTALGLAQAGVSVTVIEAEPGINDSPRAAVYFPTTIKILDRLGLLEDTCAIAYLSESFCFHLLATGEVARIANTFPPGSPYPYNAHPGQHLLAQLLLTHFSALSDAVMRWRTRLVGLEQNASGVTLTVESPRGRERSQWVVGADGARSTVRNLLSLPFEGHTWPERFVATNAGLPEESIEQRIRERYAVLLPDPAAPYQLVAFSPYRVHERCAPAFRIGRTLLAGDAAHACNPCGGMGLTGGVIDAAAIIDVLGAVCADGLRCPYSTSTRPRDAGSFWR
jgi:2-polyprenyl-6-methoxyphenol hydroxylase-like FAD-dependent oxidoreductase